MRQGYCDWVLLKTTAWGSLTHVLRMLRSLPCGLKDAKSLALPEYSPAKAMENAALPAMAVGEKKASLWGRLKVESSPYPEVGGNLVAMRGLANPKHNATLLNLLPDSVSLYEYLLGLLGVTSEDVNKDINKDHSDMRADMREMREIREIREIRDNPNPTTTQTSTLNNPLTKIGTLTKTTTQTTTMTLTTEEISPEVRQRIQHNKRMAELRRNRKATHTEKRATHTEKVTQKNINNKRERDEEGGTVGEKEEGGTVGGEKEEGGTVGGEKEEREKEEGEKDENGGGELRTNMRTNTILNKIPKNPYAQTNKKVKLTMEERLKKGRALLNLLKVREGAPTSTLSQHPQN